jgi:N-methylhydantoinase A
MTVPSKGRSASNGSGVLARFKVTCDVGGTFTDVVAIDDSGEFAIGKSSTTPHRLVDGLRDAIDVAADQLKIDRRALLDATDLFVYSTTQATNALLEGTTAKTALLCTEGFPDVLVRREGGSMHPFDFRRPVPEPYVPRRLTFEVKERIDADGNVVVPLDREAVRATLRRLQDLRIESVAVCLLWSIADPSHEKALGELIEEVLPGLPYTLSHQVNPIVREYRRTSCTALDASLKPLMQAHLRALEQALAGWGFKGELVAANSFGGVLPMESMVERPVYALRSGPALAPVAGRYYAKVDLDAENVIVCDTGGTSFDVGLVRAGEIVSTQETWLGERFEGHMTGLSSVDVRSIGAGGGSIASIDSVGLLRVGPESAGATPGPACYGRGGSHATVTDAALVLGYLDPDAFLGGRMHLDVDRARDVIGAVAERLSLDLLPAAYGILTIANESMVSAIAELTINQGLDPRESVMVAGGGAAGLGIAEIARSLGLTAVLIPRTAGALSAFGAQRADIVAEATGSLFTRSDDFPYETVGETISRLEDSLAGLADRLRGGRVEGLRLEHSVEARYAHQAWELEVQLADGGIRTEADLAQLLEAFHDTHERVFAVNEPGQSIETTQWRVRLRASPRKPEVKSEPGLRGSELKPAGHREAYFPEIGQIRVPVFDGAVLPVGAALDGPALIIEPTTTIVLPPEVSATVTAGGNYLLAIGAR